MNKLISIILPVYNVEEYLDKCIETVVNQTYKSVQIILVDDGSTDGSGSICEEWKNRDKRIEVIHKQNEGLGMARNSGLEIAKGDYVLFVDSDDFIELNMVEILLDNLHDADTVLCGYKVYYSDDKVLMKEYPYNDIIDGNIIEKFIPIMMGTEPDYKDDVYIPVSVWHGLYSMDIIKKNHILFQSERNYISEDMIFDIDYFVHSTKISCISDCLYYYRKNNVNSLTTVYNPERFEKEKVLYMELYRKLRLIMPEKFFKTRLQRTFLGRVRSCITRAVKQRSNTYKEIKKICCDPMVQKVLEEYPYRSCNRKLRIFNYCIRKKYVILILLLVKIRYKDI